MVGDGGVQEKLLYASLPHTYCSVWDAVVGKYATQIAT